MGVMVYSRRGRILGIGLAVAVVLVCVRWVWASGPPRVTTQPSGSAEEGLVETFVLTPIVMRPVGFPVPADVLGPITNQSCRAWKARSQSCYLPSAVLAAHASSATPGLRSLLERHLSAWLDAWKVGAWPPDGASLVFDLERYHQLEHLWLSMYIDLRDEISGCWLRGGADPEQVVNNAASQPAAHIEIEVFGSTRDVEGYPHKKGF